MEVDPPTIGPAEAVAAALSATLKRQDWEGALEAAEAAELLIQV
jgi:hypothetical protein